MIKIIKEESHELHDTFNAYLEFSEKMEMGMIIYWLENPESDNLILVGCNLKSEKYLGFKIEHEIGLNINQIF